MTRLLGRDPSADFTVVVRRPDRSPVVIENAPFLDDGRPMPTRWWLVDPDLRLAVSRLEALGGVQEAAAAVDALELARAHARYAAVRDSLVPPGRPGPRPSGGVGGTRTGVKCLHAHMAWFLAGGEDPVGVWTATRLGIDRHSYRRSPVAAVDCGTNSTRLLVVDDAGATLDRQMRITRLGEGVDATGRLSPPAMRRTLSVLEDYRRRMDELGVGRARLVATSAARDAANADEFLHEVADATGIHPEVLSGDEEGRLSFAGATAALPAAFDRHQAVLVVDIGGGSTELVVGRPSAPEAARAVSLDIGCVRVAERFSTGDPPAPEEMAEARSFVGAELTRAQAELPSLPGGGPVVGLAGTVSTLASLEQGLVSYDRRRIHHAVLSRRRVEHWLALLSTEPSRLRLARPGMVAGREDVIHAGVLVLDCVMEVFERAECLVSEDDILDGLAASVRHGMG